MHFVLWSSQFVIFQVTEAILSYKKLLIFAGFYPDDEKNQNDRFYYLRSFISWFMSLLIYVPMVIEIFLNLNDFTVISNVLYYSMTQTSYLCKLVNFTVNCKKVQLLEQILNSPNFNRHSTGIENNCIKTVIKTSHIMAIAFRSGIVSLCILYLIYPHFESDSDALALPGWYPLNTTKYRNWIITTQVLSVAVSAHNNSTLDLLNYTLIMLGTAQFEILIEKLVKIYEFGKGTDKIKKQICECIEHHQKIIE